MASGSRDDRARPSAVRLERGPLAESDLPAFAALSRTEYADGEPSDEAHLRWKLLENPQGPTGLRRVVAAEGAVAGRLCFQAREFRWQGRRLRAGYLVDLLVDPAHRGLRTFLALTKNLRDTPDLDFLYVTPNARSAPLYASALRLPEPLALSVVGLPLRAAPFLSRLGGLGRALARPADLGLRALVRGLARLAPHPRGLQVTEEAPPDSALDALDTRASSADRLEGRRDAAFHRWRFRSAPRRSYRVRYLHRDGALAGYVVTRVAEYLGFRALFLIDLWCDATIGRSELRFVKRVLLEEGLAEGCDLVLGILMRQAPGLRELCSLPLVRVPERLLPQPVPMHVVPLGDLPLPAEPDRWYVTTADLDVF